jgi:formylglycine-generating enzyme required for sulfatase activity
MYFKFYITMKKVLFYFIACAAMIIGLSACGGNGNDSDKNYTETVGNTNIEMIFVKGGTFTMGSNYKEGGDSRGNEEPAHKVTLSDFYVGKYEVTQAQWEAVMGTSITQQRDKEQRNEEKRTKSKITLSMYGEGSDYPMYYVSWDEAQQFCRKVSSLTGKQYRLLTEAEWEYAAHGGKKSKGRKYSGDNSPDNVAWYSENSGKSTHPVGTKAPNELGVYDMNGNVYDWCSDKYENDYRSRSPQNNPLGTLSGSNFRVMRGGSYSNDAKGCNVTYRTASNPDGRGELVGFRLALVPWQNGMGYTEPFGFLEATKSNPFLGVEVVSFSTSEEDRFFKRSETVEQKKILDKMMEETNKKAATIYSKTLYRDGWVNLFFAGISIDNDAKLNVSEHGSLSITVSINELPEAAYPFEKYYIILDKNGNIARMQRVPGSYSWDLEHRETQQAIRNRYYDISRHNKSGEKEFDGIMERRRQFWENGGTAETDSYPNPFL